MIPIDRRIYSNFKSPITMVLANASVTVDGDTFFGKEFGHGTRICDLAGLRRPKEGRRALFRDRLIPASLRASGGLCRHHHIGLPRPHRRPLACARRCDRRDAILRKALGCRPAPAKHPVCPPSLIQIIQSLLAECSVILKHSLHA